MNDNNKIVEISFLLPVLGFFLFSPILLSIFDGSQTMFGIPYLHIYLFASWLLLLIVGFILTKKLPDPTNVDDHPLVIEQDDQEDNVK